MSEKELNPPSPDKENLCRERTWAIIPVNVRLFGPGTATLRLECDVHKGHDGSHEAYLTVEHVRVVFSW